MEELVIEAQQGNNEALSKLILLIKQDLYKIAISRLHNIEDANDVMQNTLLALYLKIHTLEEPEYFKTWIIKILINECNDFYSNNKKQIKLVEKFSKHVETEAYIENSIDFDNMIKILNENHKQIFKLYYEYHYSTSDIAKILNMNESTVRADLSKGRQKLKHKYKSLTFVIFFICLAVLTTVGAVCLIDYIKGLFETRSIGEKNDGILNSIENLDWYQQVDMDYIDLGKGNKIKVDYVLMDEMNLYMIFDYISETDISNFDNITLSDLKITDENGDLICYNDNAFLEQYAKYIGNKTIEHDKNHIKFLQYMYANSFPVSKSLNINFSKITLSKKAIFNKNKYLEIDTNANFIINLDEKFQIRNFTTYNSESNQIEKAIITETGFYSIIQLYTIMNKAEIIDQNNNIYYCTFVPLTTYDNKNNSIIRFVITSDFNDTNNLSLKLIINNIEYNLSKKN